MTGKVWLKYFTSIMSSKLPTYYPEEKKFDDTEWTKFMNSVMDDIGRKMDWYVAQWRTSDPVRSGEYLNIDAFFIEKSAFDPRSDYSKYDPFVLPKAVVELENKFDFKWIGRCLWKILCIRSPIRALICYQNSSKKISDLKQYLESVIQEGNLMEKDTGSLFIIIGNESKMEKNKSGKYTWRSEPLANIFDVYEWKNNKLMTVEGLKW